MISHNTPILVGCGQITDRTDSKHGPTPIDMMTASALSAVQDSGVPTLLNDIDHLIAVGLTVDAVGFKTPLSGNFSNVPKSVAKRLGIAPKNRYYTCTGGNTPQALVNHFAGEIAAGRAGTVLLTGGEALHTMRVRFNHWSKLLLPRGRWRDHPGGHVEIWGNNKPGATKLEAKYGLDYPVNVYPLFENALRHQHGRSREAHMQHIGKLFEDLNRVAANNPLAWFQQSRSAHELITPSPANRFIAYPYTKLLNSMLYVNQSASVILTSVGRARALGISMDKWVFLHGCANANDQWNITDRVNYYSSPALRRVGQEALRMAGKSINDIDVFDLYSCFSSALQIAQSELGIAVDDQRPMTVTGGLPYFGGPGNNYSMHAIAEMMQILRVDPHKFGLINANGWFLTKHAVGIYSATPVAGTWQRPDSNAYQQEILQHQGPVFNKNPLGNGHVETYTVVFNKHNQPERAIVIGHLDSTQRFLATTDNSSATLQQLMEFDVIGRRGTVTQTKRKAVFRFDC